MEKILLASSSPRRAEVLRSLSIPFSIIHPDIDEGVFDNLDPEHRVAALAERKALAGEALLGQGNVGIDAPRLLLAADTLVAFHGPKSWKTIGKPRDRAEAAEMLSYMEGRTHTVFSGLCLLDRSEGRRFSVCSSTKVRFAPMDRGEIEEYLDSGEWRGAAGAYRVQGLGSCYIERLEGSWSCVVGLPIRELYGILKEAGYDFTPAKGASAPGHRGA